MNKKEFAFSYKPIASVQALARTLCEYFKNKPPFIVTEKQLHHYASDTSRYYSVFKKSPLKEDGSTRITYTIKKDFKKILKRIQVAILDEIVLPDYVVGGVKGASAITNAQTHASPLLLQAEDITNFFPSISIHQVKRVFQHCCHFPPEVSQLLAKLCTYNGFLAQGSPTSGHLANLVFFFIEPKVVAWLKERGLTYSRLYDDVSISSKEHNFHKEIFQIRAVLYNMFDSVGVKKNSKKRKVMSSLERVEIHKMTANTNKLSPSKKRVSNVRIEVFSFEKLVKNKSDLEIIISKYRSIKGKISNIKQQGCRHWQKHQTLLDKVLGGVDEQEAKKFFRKFRKIKNRKTYNGLRLQVAVLKKINPALSKIADLEAKMALLKLKNNEAEKL